jgi:hypothetical protein
MGRSLNNLAFENKIFLANEKFMLEEMMQVLGSKIGKIQQEELVIEETLQEIVQNYGGQLSGDVKTAFNKLEEHVLELKRGAGFFKVS